MKASVVVRTKNEAAWIHRCLTAVFGQDFPEFEVIVVDNASSDDTLAIVDHFDCRLVKISESDFTFGRSLNWGFRAATGDVVASLSGHCIPVNDQWLQALSAPFLDPKVAGTYGRQEPLPDSDAFNKRDMWTTFGIERRIQTRDYFFHNANSMIRRDLWAKTPFDEDIHGVEDRDWGKKMIARGYRLVYEPTASVFHHHGIHHGRDERRAERVVRVIQSIAEKNGS